LETQSEFGNIYANLVLDTWKLTAEWPGQFFCKTRSITTPRFSGIGGEKGNRVIEARQKGCSQLPQYYGLF